jgi:hypothetical protein
LCRPVPDFPIIDDAEDETNNSGPWAKIIYVDTYPSKQPTRVGSLKSQTQDTHIGGLESANARPGSSLPFARNTHSLGRADLITLSKGVRKRKEQNKFFQYITKTNI